jgi:heterodisulfide reductase subunit C
MSDYLAHSRCRYRRRRKLVDKLWTSILSVTCQERCQEKNGIPGVTEFIHHLCNST